MVTERWADVRYSVGYLTLSTYGKKVELGLDSMGSCVGCGRAIGMKTGFKNPFSTLFKKTDASQSCTPETSTTLC